MTLLGLIVILILAGAGLMIVKILPIDETVKQIIKILCIVAIAIAVLLFLWAFLPPLISGHPLTR